MGIIKKDRVNMVITDQYIRYSYQANPSEAVGELGEIELPEGVIERGEIKNTEVFQKTIDELVQAKRWKRKNLSVALPDISVVVREHKADTPLTREEALAFVKTQAGRSFHLPFSNPVFAVDFFNGAEASKDLIIYAYSKDRLDAFLNVFQDAGLKPIVADLTTLSVYRYFYLNDKIDNEDLLLVHWNHQGLTRTAFHKHQAIFMRYMNLNENIAELLQIGESMIEGMIRNYVVEMIRITDFYQYSIRRGTSSVDLILLTGDFPYLDIVEKEISDATDIPVHYESKIINDEAIKYIDVIGLGMKKSP